MKEEIRQEGFKVLLIGMGTPEESRKFKKELEIDFTMVCDTKKELYKAYSLKRASMGDMLNPSLLVKGLGAMVQGNRMGMPNADPNQLSGVFVINTDGEIQWDYISDDPSDYPGKEEILNALKNIKEKQQT